MKIITIYKIVVFIAPDCPSVQINIGVIEGNPDSPPGSIEVLNHLSKFVPVSADGQLYPVVLNGDGGL